MRRLVIFGAGKIADEAYFYFTHDSPYEVVAFTVDAAHIQAPHKWGLPVVPFEEAAQRFPPADHDMFVAIGYHQLNALRAQKYLSCKASGYNMASYISSRAANFGNVEPGDNCFILEHVTLQPCSRIGSNVFIWSGNHIGHHAHVRDHCYIAGHVVVSGGAVIEPYCFVGVNATIGHEVTIGEASFLGAGVVVTKNAASGSVYIRKDTPRFRLDAQSFLRLTRMK